MKNKIKLIWKFSGPDADHIAKHHLVHLKEYIEKENIEIFTTGYERLNENIAISFVIISEGLLEKIKNDLKPHEGFIV
ncbi:MAG: hypothetical protein CL831_02980 [Crocinitomicaceae bacterium]|nr:hypothetical protein [Crocinitomicaceae bacterium]